MISPASKHARVRMQQRSLSPVAVDWIVAFGKPRRVGGADVFALDRKGRKRLREHLGHSVYNQVAPILDALVVVADDGSIVTAAHRTRRLLN